MKRIFGKNKNNSNDDSNEFGDEYDEEDDDQVRELGRPQQSQLSRRQQQQYDGDEFVSVAGSGGDIRRAPGRIGSGPLGNNRMYSSDATTVAGGGGGSGGGTTNMRGDELSVDPSSFNHSAIAGQIRPNYRAFLNSGGTTPSSTDPRSKTGIGAATSGDGNDTNIGAADPNVAGGAGNLNTSKAFLSGTNRLNRILSTTGQSLFDGPTVGGDYLMDDDDLILEAVGLPSTNFNSNNNANNGNAAGGLTGTDKFGAGRIVKVSDPTNLEEVGSVCARYVIPPLKVDPASIGGNMLDGYPETMLQETLLIAACSNFESTGGTDTIPASALQYPAEYTKHKRSLGLFGGSSNKGRATKRRFVLLARSTNKPLLGRPKDMDYGFTSALYQHNQNQQNQQNDAELLLPNPRRGKGAATNDMGEESERADYDAMFAPDDNLLLDAAALDGEEGSTSKLGDSISGTGLSSKDAPITKRDSMGGRSSTSPSKQENIAETTLPAGRVNFDVLEADQEEISSFPVLICMTLNQDGTAPDIRKLISLDQLTTVQDLHSTVVQLAFNNGDTIRLDFGGNVNDKDKAVERSALDKERFIWSLLQIHAILCMAVVERNSIESNLTSAVMVPTAGKTDRNYLPPLNVRNLDRAELQYVATVNGFLRKSKLLCALLERQRSVVEHQNSSGNNAKDSTTGGSSSKKKLGSSASTKTGDAATVDGNGSSTTPGTPKDGADKPAEETKMDMETMEEMAYDLMMGNFATRVTLFQSEEERKDAEEILNSEEWTNLLNVTMNANNTGNEYDDHQSSAAMNVAHIFGTLLQGRMRDLEAETCRRLIAWEDEKSLSLRGTKSGLHDESDDRDTVDALALASLFKTLEALDTELLSMETWLQDRAAAIKPLTDDCADIEEENRQLEQQWKSYDMLGAEMRRLLQGLEINEYTEQTLTNPASALVYRPDGSVNVDACDDGIEKIYEAGKALLDAIEYPKRSGGMHLKSVSERAKGLATISHGFCSSLAQIIVTVMEQFKADVVAGSDHGKVSKSDTHSMIAKKVRDTQRKFQSALLGYIKLIEILTALSPEMLPALRDAYAEMVAEGILMKKRMKGYFQALPAKNVAFTQRAGKDLKEYVPFVDPPLKEEMVNAPDIRAVLSELLPVIAREAYFTSALFGSTKKEQDGREKKRNFENAKNAVDKASVHFRYYVNRTCGIVDSEANRAVDLSKVDPMLCLVATIYLNEAMDNYIDREKKGGDHSLSLAYVRATILDLRKKADKQWVAWVEKQIEWIKTHEGVPPTGKRAGVFASFARFPKYLDHLIQCCSEGRDQDYVPDLAGIKVINYYLQKLAVNLLESLKECSTRESTEKSYAANVMKMENTYFFTQSIKQRGEVMTKLFSKQVMKANAICKESTDAYLGWMIKREFTALHELFSRVSKARKEVGDREVIKHVPKDQFVKILQKEANRDVLKEKIGAMFTRMEKHLSEEGGLLIVAWKALVKVLYEWFGRWEKLCTSIYQHKIDPSAVDVVRIAKAAGGGGGSTTAGSTVKPSATTTSTTSGDTTNQASSSDFAFKSILALGSGGSNNNQPPANQR